MGSEALGKRVRTWRKNKKLPLKAVAKALNVSEATVSDWERGTRFPSRTNLDALAKFMDGPVCALFCENEDSCEHYDLPQAPLRSKSTR